MPTTKKPITEHAQAAKAIRTTLKAAYPHTKFAVRSSSYTGGCSVDIHWTDGPTVALVNALVHKHKECSMDLYTDMKVASNTQEDVPQVDFVHCHREYSRETFLAIVEFVNARFGWSLVPEEKFNRVNHSSDSPRGNNSGWKSHEIWPTFSGRSLVCPECKTPALWDDAYCAECGSRLAPEDQA